MAIADRVLHTACERFPVLSTLRLRDGGPDFQAFKERSAAIPTDQLEPGIRFILTEFLSVLGDLTADILSPALHQELAQVAREIAGKDEADLHSSAERPPGQGAKESPE